MPDEVEKNFVKCFITFLKQQIQNQSLSADGLESVEVSIQCLEAAFEVNNGDEPASASSSSNEPKDALANINLFEVFQSLYAEKNPESKELAEQIKNEGNRLMKEAKYYEALIQYNRAITFDPKNPVFYCNRAATYIRLGEHDKAIADCKLALVYNPKYGKAYGRMGIAYSNLNKFDDARSAYLKAIELEPDNQDYKNNLRVAEERLAQQPTGPTGDAAAFNAQNLPNLLMQSLSNPNMGTFIRDMMQDPMITTALQSLASNPEGLLDMSRQVASQLSQDNPDFLRNIRDQLNINQQGGTNPVLFGDALGAFQGNQNSGGGNNDDNNASPDQSQQPPPSS